MASSPIPTTGTSPLSIVIAVEHRSLGDALAQVLVQLEPPPQVQFAASPDDLHLRLHAAQPALLIVDPFTMLKSTAPDDGWIKRLIGDTPLITLLPSDTREYRDFAVRLGSNGMVTVENAATDLIPTIETVLTRADLAQGVAQQISALAERSAPLGESAASREARALHARSDRTVARLAPQVTDQPPLRPTPDQPRIFLRGLTLAAAAPDQPHMTHVYHSACSVNCGQHYCGFDVTVRNERVVKVEPADFPDPRYRRICLKGISYVQMIAHPDRLLHPLKRVGPRGGGDWQPITWERALDEIAAKTRAITGRHGTRSLMFMPYSGQLSALNGMSGAYLRLASVLGASATDPSQFGLDSAVPSGIAETFGSGTGYQANAYEDLINTRLVLIWGANPVYSAMNWWPFFLEARRAGARLVTIDTRYSATASKSDEWLNPRPGSDLYLALALLHQIVYNGWADMPYVQRHTVGPLLVRSDTGRFLRNPDAPHTFLVWDRQQDRVVPAQDAHNPALEGDFRINGTLCRPAYAHLREMLAPYTPALAAEKTGIPAARIEALAHQYAHARPARIFTLYGIDRWHHGGTFGRLIATLGALTGNIGIPGGGVGVGGQVTPALPYSGFSQPDGQTFHPVNPASLPDQIVTGRPHPIKAVWIAFSNWLNQWPDQNWIKDQVLPRLDLIVTAEHFMTETARYSDYVLPAAMTFEREDFVTGPGPYLQHQSRIADPPGECHSDFEMAAALAQRLGCERYFDQPPEHYLREILATNLDPLDGITLDDLREKGVVRRDLAPEQRIAHYQQRFPTTTGRIEFYSERLAPLGRALPDYEPPAEADLTQPQTYPLVCITEHSRYRVHSTFGNAPWLREIAPGPHAALHPDVAAARGIAEGDLVRIFNARGHVVLPATISAALPVDTVYLTQGWQSADFVDGHAQTLTHRRWNPLNQLGPNTSFSDVLVEVAAEATPS